MRRRSLTRAMPLGIAIVLAAGFAHVHCAQQNMPFGGQEDVAFAQELWNAMGDYSAWALQSDVYPGQSPHGQVLRMYYNYVHVQGEPYHVIVKDNFGGEGASVETVAQAPGEYLAAVTVMLQRETGYDAPNDDWFYVKYQPDGTIARNDADVPQAGRVAKGMDQGCIACHRNAGGEDFIFTNDE